MDFLAGLVPKSISDWYDNLHLTYDGQGRAENWAKVIVLLFGAIGFIWGFIIQQFSATVWILGAGFLLAAILTVPPWPIHNKKHLEWADPKKKR